MVHVVITIKAWLMMVLAVIKIKIMDGLCSNNKKKIIVAWFM